MSCLTAEVQDPDRVHWSLVKKFFFDFEMDGLFSVDVMVKQEGTVFFLGNQSRLPVENHALGKGQL